jgi:hypothetical protein
VSLESKVNLIIVSSNLSGALFCFDHIVATIIAIGPKVLQSKDSQTTTPLHEWGLA